MNQSNKYLYSPALRLKAGEMAGVAELAADVAACTLPRYIIPPRSERDPDQPMLLILHNEPDVSAALARNWWHRECFVDVTHILDECGRERMADWLPRLFTRARSAGALPIPMALLDDLISAQIEAYRACIDWKTGLKFGIVVPSSQLEGAEFRFALEAALTGLGVTYTDCAIVADFSDADLSLPILVEPIIRGVLEDLQFLGAWRHITFQGTHFPDTNPAQQHDTTIRWPRNEWAAWKLAVKFDPQTADYLMFGDYAADCAKMVFGKGGARAIRHYRYTTESEWLVVRAPEVGKDQVLMQGVCAKILASGDFAGPSFSSADAYIARTAERAGGPGNATIWRQVNTTHHITRVIADIAKVRGIEIARREVIRNGEQLSLI